MHGTKINSYHSTKSMCFKFDLVSNWNNKVLSSTRLAIELSRDSTTTIDFADTEKDMQIWSNACTNAKHELV